MADIRCPNCGKDNPDFLNVCQFCQAPLRVDGSLQFGDKPTKKNTGELEPVLPDWLKDVRQQARDSAEEEGAGAGSMPKVQKDEPPDLLAGLASQGASSEEDVPDWLAGLRPKTEERPASSPSPAQPASDVFARFEKQDPGPINESASPAFPEEPAQPSSKDPDRDELSDWFAQASEQPSEPFSPDEEPASPDSGWGFQQESAFPSQKDETPQQEEDLSWLRSLEAESKKTGELAPKQEDDWSSMFGAPGDPGTSRQDDLSWLDSLGSLPASEQKPGEELGWLEPLSSASTPPPSPAEQTASPDDSGWLKSFADSSPPSASQDDLSWLEGLDATSSPASDLQKAQPAADEDLDWLRGLQESAGPISATPSGPSIEQEPPRTPDLPHVSPFTPRRTAPLNEGSDPSIPDWLKSAAEQPSMPLGPQALDQFREDYNIPTSPEAPFSWKNFGMDFEGEEEKPAPSQPDASSSAPGLPSPAGDAAPLFSQDVDSIFSTDMPDWLTQPEPEASQPAEEIGVHAEGGEALSPADLPSWVQAMRPVEAVISATTPGVDDQPLEREGPLAGLRGVIPAAAIGSLRKPQPIPLTLQASDEQQASAGVLEQLLADETTVRPLAPAPETVSQRQLRWVIAGLLLLVLSVMIFSGTQIMPVSASLPPEASEMTGVVIDIPENALVLVILDYEPALAGEMEAASGPLLDQMVQLRRPYLAFITTSPSGNALVERLLANTDISQPDGQRYAAGEDYTNMGYLPGGESGVLAFLQSPQAAIPSSPVQDFSGYAAILLLTDHAESARAWVEQIHTMKESDLALASQPLLAVSSAQAGPMILPYFSSGQVDGLLNGLANAARYELLNNNRPGIARSYWDAFGVGMMMAVAAIVLGSLWSLFTVLRARRAETAEE